MTLDPLTLPARVLFSELILAKAKRVHKHRPRVVMIAEYPWSDDDLARGGVIQANYRLVSALGEIDELDLWVVTPSANVATAEMREVGGASILFFPPRNIGYDTLFLYWGLRRSLRTLLTVLKPDLVHAQALPSFILAALGTKLPCIVTIHGIYKNELRVARMHRSLKQWVAAVIMKELEAYNFSRIANLIAITSEIESIVRYSSPRARIFRINNAVDYHFFTLNDLCCEPTVLFIGWIMRRKGVHLLLEAVGTVIGAIPDVKVRIVGLDEREPRYAAWLRSKYAHLICTGTVSFVGRVGQVQLYQEVSRCSLLCLPSLAESAPMVIAEAMAAGKPVVASRVGGIPEMVEDGVSGRLFEVGNVEALSECLIELLREKERARSMGAAARRLAEIRYAPQSVARRTVQAYYEVLGLVI